MGGFEQLPLGTILPWVSKPTKQGWIQQLNSTTKFCFSVKFLFTAEGMAPMFWTFNKIRTMAWYPIIFGPFALYILSLFLWVVPVNLQCYWGGSWFVCLRFVWDTVGHITPNLNGEGRFLRGGMEEEMLNLEVLGVAFEGTIMNYISKYEHIIMHNMEVGSLTIVYSINL